MVIFVHLALDSCGAETLGKLSSYLSTSGEARNRHLFVWGGVQSAPENDDYWLQRYPAWDERLWEDQGENPYCEADHGKIDLQLNRGTLIARVAQLCSENPFREKLRKLFLNIPIQRLGAHVERPITATVVCSLAEPVSSALLLGLLRGFEQLRLQGEYLKVPLYVFAGIGAASSTTVDQESLRRAMAARSLLDLQQFFTASKSWAQVASPVYIVGDDQGVDRLTQVSVLAQGLFALGCILQGSPAKKGDNNPFAFHIDTDQRVNLSGDIQKPERPFTMLGARAYCCPYDKVMRLLAFGACRDLLALYAEQTGWENLKDAAAVSVPDELRNFLDKINAESSTIFWEKVERKQALSWDPQDRKAQKENPTWFDVRHLRQLTGKLFSQDKWQQLVDWYSYDRVATLPLEDWEGALNEIEEIVERGYLPRRQQQLEAVIRNLLLAQVEALDEGVTQVFAKAPQAPVGYQPHEAAQIFLGRVYRNVEHAIASYQQQNLGSNRQAENSRNLQKQLMQKRAQLLETIEALPSPAAVLIRLIPWAALLVGLGMVMPFPVVADTIIARLGFGFSIAVLGCSLFFWREVSRVKRLLLRQFNEWFSVFKRATELRDDSLREGFYEQLLSQMKLTMEWYIAAEEEHPPLPNRYQTPLKVNRSGEKPLETTCLTRKTALMEFRDWLTEARLSFSREYDGLKKTFHATGSEQYFPNILEIEQTYAEHFGNQKQQKLSRFFRSVAQELDPEERLNIPFVDQTSGRASANGWRSDFKLPTTSQLCSSEIRESSCAWRFLHTVVGRVHAELSDSMTLSEQLGKHPQQKELLNDFSNPGRFSIAATVTRRSDLLLASAPEDPVARLRIHNVTVVVDDNKYVSVSLWAAGGVSADEIIHYPNAQHPTTPLGMAWKWQTEQEKLFPALTPLI